MFRRFKPEWVFGTIAVIVGIIIIHFFSNMVNDPSFNEVRSYRMPENVIVIYAEDVILSDEVASY